MSDDQDDIGYYRQDGKTPRGVAKGARGKQQRQSAPWEWRDIDTGVIQLVETPFRIRFDPDHADGRPAQIWHGDDHIATYAKLNVARDMAEKKANELRARGEL